jgi:acyl-CoA synthetase (AMP-forming)/AMP-acid ligase II
MTLSFNLVDLIESVADVIGEREAVVSGDRRLTYAQLDERANRLAHVLQDQGIKQGDHVGLYLYNGIEYLEGTLASFKIRAVPININYRYVEEELHYLFDNADLAGLIHHREFAPRVAAVSPRVPSLRTFISVDDGSDADLSALDVTDYETALATASPERDFGERSGDDLYILYTGGTTGMPKGVMWRHEDLFYAALMGGNPYGAPPDRPEQVAENAAAGNGLTQLPSAPLMHGAAQWSTFIFLLSGGKIVLAPGKRFEPKAIWQLVEREKVQTLQVVGDAMARPLAEALDGTDYDLSSLFVIGSGGATFSEGVKEQLKAKLPNIMLLDSFGGSEGGNQGQSVPRDADAPGPRFKADDTTAVLDEDLKPLPPGTGKAGMLARKGRIPLGYYKDAEKTARTFIEANGARWVVAGDMAMVEADGTVTLLGRGTNCINSGGEKIFPEEVEAALRTHPAVFDAIVVGVPDDRWGERIAAVIAPRPGEMPALEDLDAHCRTHISGYKVPRELHIVGEIQRQPSGKPDYKWAKEVAMGEKVAAPSGGAA